MIEPGAVSEGVAVDDDAAGEEMFADLGRFAPGSIPVDAVMSRGREIKLRRRLVGTGALVLAACLVVLAPVAARWGGGAEDPVPVAVGPAGAGPTQRVSLVPPHYDARSRVDFAGSVDGKPWSYKLGGRCDGPKNRCMDLVGLVLPPVSLLLEPTTDGNVGISAEFGDQVLYAVLTLSSGEQITLTGITVITGQNVAIASQYFEIPRGETVVDIAAYGGMLDDGLIGHADPRPLRSDIPTVVPWYKPDGGVLSLEAPRFRLSQGGSGAGAWNLDVEVGSWENWFVYSNGAGSHTESVSAGLRTGSFPSTMPGREVSAVYGLVSGVARRVDVTFSDGTVAHLVPVISGTRAFAGTVAPAGATVVSTAQYDGAGKLIPRSSY